MYRKGSLFKGESEASGDDGSEKEEEERDPKGGGLRECHDYQAATPRLWGRGQGRWRGVVPTRGLESWWR